LIAESKIKKPGWVFSNNSFDGQSLGIKVIGKSFNSNHYEKQVPFYFSGLGGRWRSVVAVPKREVLDRRLAKERASNNLGNL